MRKQEMLTFKCPKSVIESLRKDFKLPENTSNITVFKKVLAVAGFILSNGEVTFENGKTLYKINDAILDVEMIS